MGSSAPQTTTQVNKVELPEWLNKASQENLALADKIASRPYQAYSGSLIAGFSPEQTQAFDYAKAGIGQTAPAFNLAQGAAANTAFYQPTAVAAQTFPGADMSGYMNPYINQVEGRAIDNAQRSLLTGINQIGDQAAMSKAFGGSRQGIREGVATAEAARGIGDLSANLRMTGYNNAAQLQQADAQRALQAAMGNQSAGLQGAALNLQGASTLGSLASQGQQSRAMDSAMLESIGGQKQAQEKSLLDDAYARFLEERNYPIEMLNLRLGATSATPYGKTETSTKTGASGNSLMTGIGTVGTAASAALSIAQLAAM